MIKRLVFVIVCFYSVHAHAAGQFYTLYKDSRCPQFVPASMAELQTVKALFSRALANQQLDDPAYRQQWQALGYDWQRMAVAGRHWWVANEKTSSCRGQGLYLFDPAANSSSLLQVPHRFKDASTGAIARKWLASGTFRAVAWNTIPRTVVDSQGQQADLAHRWDSYFVALAQAYAQQYADGVLLQLHGFASSKRRTAAGREASVIVSAGHEWPGKTPRQIYNCLAGKLGQATRLYPVGVQELGATRNVQGRLLRNLGHNGFVHIELSDAMRGQLLNDRSLLNETATCLATTGAVR